MQASEQSGAHTVILGLKSVLLVLGIIYQSPVQICSGIIHDRVLHGELYTHRIQKLIYRYNRGSNQYVNKHVNICCAAGSISECIC